MFNLKSLLVLILVTNFSFAEPITVTPCQPHRGKPLPWEGSGACTGNVQLEIPLQTTGLSLIYNSVDSKNDYGFGAAAWRLSVDHRLIDESALITNKKITLDRGDGTQIPFTKETNFIWSASPVLSKSELAYVGGLWYEKNLDGSQIIYSRLSGNIWVSIAFSDSKGNVTSIVRNSEGKIRKVRNPFGKEVVFAYQNTPLKVATATDYQGKVYNFSYAKYGQLMEVAYPDGTGWKLQYGVGVDLDSNPDPTDMGLSTVVSMAIDSKSNSTLYHDISRYTGELEQGIISHTRTSGNLLYFYTFTADQVSSISEVGTSEETFINGRLVKSTQNGETTTIVLKTSGPALGLPSMVIDPIGAPIVYDYDDNLNVNYIKDSNKIETYITYDKYNPTIIEVKNGTQTVKKMLVTYENGRVHSYSSTQGDDITYNRDAKGNILSVFRDRATIKSFTYNEKSLLTSQTIPLTARTTRYGYNSSGYLTSITDHLDNVTYITPNELGQPLEIRTAEGLTKTLQYDNSGENIFSSTVGPSGTPYTVRTSRTSAPSFSIDASFKFKRKQTIEASFNYIPLLSKILPWKQALASDPISYLPTTEVETSTGIRQATTEGLMDVREVATSEFRDVPTRLDPPSRPPQLDPPIPMPMPASSGVAQSTASTCDKPVIYLYPQKTQSVKVVLNFLGSLTATYPEYDVKKNGWSVIARQDGTLTDVQDGKEYSYLYWEGLSNKSLDIDYSKGFIVAGKDTRKFMQDTLAKMGLTPKEYNEFIVYWYPRMKDNVFNYIHFAGKPYTDTAKLTITPKPDSMLRVFMAFKPLESATEMKVTAQEFPKFVRKGFVVVEWGGGEVGGPEGMKLGKKIATGSAVNQME